jgi:hypothetical protein
MYLKVTKSHTGQNKAPPINVGSRSRFSLAIISDPFSPDFCIKMENSESLITFGQKHKNKIKQVTNVTLLPLLKMSEKIAMYDCSTNN